MWHPRKNELPCFSRVMDKVWSHALMVSRWVIFCKVICQICWFWFPVYAKVILLDSINYPEESHIDCFCAFLFYSFVQKSCCCAIICLDGCWGLVVTHFEEGCTNLFAISAVGEDCTDFRLRGRWHDIFHDRRDGVYGTIWLRWVLVWKVKMATCSASGLWFREIGRIRVDMKNHIWFIVAYRRVGVGGDIIEEFCHCFCCCLRRLILLWGYGSKRYKDGWFYGASIIKVRANNPLNFVLFFFV